MKLVHRDFRPPRRSKYVAQPHKRRPTLRILILVAIGVAVYWKFDSVVSSPFFRNILKPTSLMKSLRKGDKAAEPAPSAAIPQTWRWSRDSSYLEAICHSPRYRECLETWKGKTGPNIGELRAVMAKTQAQWNVEPTGGFTARFLRLDRLENEGAGIVPELELSRLDMVTAAGMFSLERASGKPAFCAKDKCLDEVHPRPPFSRFLRASTPENPEGREEHPIEAVFTPLQGAVFRPVLSGRIVDVSPIVDPAHSAFPPVDTAAIPATDSPITTLTSNWVKLYHGRNLFSRYRGFARLGGGLQTGSMVRAGDTLGYVAVDGNSTGSLALLIEKDGLAVDPFAFLGLRSDSGEAVR